MKLGIVFVTYNSEKHIDRCLNSVLKSDYDLKNVGIYVYDNNSSDNTINLLEKFKEHNLNSFFDIQIIKGKKNLGFGMANNRAAKIAKTEYLFFLNIDCEIYNDTLSKISYEIEKNKNKNIAIYELRQQIYDHPKYYDPISKETDWSSGACFIIKKLLFKKVKGFDKNIFMYCEDVDLSYKLKRMGYKILYYFDIPIIHYSYNKEFEFKRIQYENIFANNLYIRLKYGSLKEILKGIILYHLFYKGIDDNKDIKKSDLESIKKEVRKNKNKMFLKGIVEYIKRIRFIFKKRYNFKFHGIEYSLIKQGAFYKIKETKNSPLVSIIVRTCNRPNVLRETLISIKNQTYKNIEVIVVEDGPNVSEKMIKDEFSSINIKYYSFGKNHGRCAAGNKGLSMATGKYINFLDDDDLFYEDHVEVLVSELENSDYEIAYSTSFETAIVVESKSPYKYKIIDKRPGITTEYNPLKLQYQNITPIQCVMFSKKVYEKCGGFDERLDALEDWDLWLNYSYNFPFKYVERTTSIYRVPGKADDSDSRKKFLDSYLLMVREKYKDKKISATNEDVLDFYKYVVYLNTSKISDRISKIKRILGRK